MAVGTGRFVETASTDICGIPRLALQQRTASGWEAAPPLDSCAGSFNCCPACCQPESEVMPPLPLACSLPERASSVRVASVVIVFNPAGGSASASRRWDAVFRCAAALRAVGIAVRLVHTEFAGHATDIAQSLPLKAARVVEPSPRLPQGALLSPAKGSEDDSDDAAATRLADARLAFRSASTPSSVPPSDDVSGDVFDCIVVGGGDGTLREVVAGLVERADGAAKTVPVVALPIGTGNSTMLDMGVHEPMDAVSAVLGGRAHSVDAFELRHSGRAAGRGPGSDGGGSASVLTPHGPTVSKDIRDPETGVIIPPGRVVGVNVIGVLAPTDATLFAERNRWLGGLRYDVGGVGCLIALPKYDFHTHFSQQLLPVSGPLPTDSDLGISPAGSGECETALGSAPSPIGGSGSSSEPGSVGAEDTPSSACAATGSAALASPCAGADADGGESKERRCGPSSSESECGSVDSACSSTAAKRAGRLPDAGAASTADSSSGGGSAGIPAGSAADRNVKGSPALSADLFAVFIQNTRHSGNGLCVAPGSRLDDGMFDVTLMPRISRLELLRGFNLLKLGGHSRLPGACLTQCRSALLSHDPEHLPGLEGSGTAASTPLVVMMDGDVLVHTPALVRIMPGAWLALTAY